MLLCVYVGENLPGCMLNSGEGSYTVIDTKLISMLVGKFDIIIKGK